MGLWSLLGTALFGGVFAVFAFFRVGILDSQTARWILCAFLFGCYCGIVVLGAIDKKRPLSLTAQTLLGVALACAIAALLRANPEGYVFAVLAGLILGFTADKWVDHVQLP